MSKVEVRLWMTSDWCQTKKQASDEARYMAARISAFFTESYINQTHTEGLGIVAVCSVPVGVNAEALNVFDAEVLMNDFTQREQMRAQRDSLNFIRIKCLKECYKKQTGIDFSSSLLRLDFSDCLDNPSKVIHPMEKYTLNHDDFYYHAETNRFYCQLILGNRFFVSICI